MIITTHLANNGMTFVRGGLKLKPDQPPESQQLIRSSLQLLSDNHIQPLTIASPSQAKYASNDNPILDTYQKHVLYAQYSQPTVRHWELFNEPDMAFSKKMPDREAALMKAVYLGLTHAQVTGNPYSVVRILKPGARRNKLHRMKPVSEQRPIVLGASLALPDGPWARRTARNGLWNYADGFNFHFYGLLDSLPTVTDNYRTFIKKLYLRNLCHSQSLPLWLTEINRAFTTPHDLTAATQMRQGEFLVAAAKIALNKEIAAFLPFTTYWKKEPTFNFFDAQGTPNASWHAYAKFTYAHPDKPVVSAKPPQDVPAVILHWEPDSETVIPHKMSGCYWPAIKGKAITGKVVITNLENRAVTGWLRHQYKQENALKRALQNGLNETLTLEPFTSITIPLVVEPKTLRYFREWLLFEFEYFRQSPRLAIKGFHLAQNKRFPIARDSVNRKSTFQNPESEIKMVQSPLFFGIEANPYQIGSGQEPEARNQKNPLIPEPLALSLPAHKKQQAKPFKSSQQQVSLQQRLDTGEEKKGESINPLTGQPLFFSDDTYTTFFVNGPTPATLTSSSPPWIGLNDLLITQTNSPAFPWMAFACQHNAQVRNYPCAIAAVDGLPDSGFLVLTTNRILGEDTWVWVYLVDTAGQQFCIWDNQGRNHHIHDNRLFLNLEDFQLLFHGLVTEQPQFVPANIREIHIRFGFSRPDHPLMFNLTFAAAPRSNEIDFWQACPP